MIKRVKALNSSQRSEDCETKGWVEKPIPHWGMNRHLLPPRVLQSFSALHLTTPLLATQRRVVGFEIPPPGQCTTTAQPRRTSFQSSVYADRGVGFICGARILSPCGVVAASSCLGGGERLLLLFAYVIYIYWAVGGLPGAACLRRCTSCQDTESFPACMDIREGVATKELTLRAPRRQRSEQQYRQSCTASTVQRVLCTTDRRTVVKYVRSRYHQDILTVQFVIIAAA